MKLYERFTALWEGKTLTYNQDSWILIHFVYMKGGDPGRSLNIW
jgi:hypothetical protein